MASEGTAELKWKECSRKLRHGCQSREVLYENDELIEKLKKQLEEAQDKIVKLLKENELLRENQKKRVNAEERKDAGNSESLREEPKKSENAEERNTVKAKIFRVMGDSMIRYAGAIPRAEGAVVVCFPGMKTEEMEKRIGRLEDEREEEGASEGVGLSVRQRTAEETWRVHEGAASTDNSGGILTRLGAEEFNKEMSLRGRKKQSINSVDAETYNPEIVVGTETWLSSTIFSNEIFPRNFTVYRRDRDTRGGGIFVGVKEEIR
ncbi:hypothetical protein J437_LFUL015695 [Ladona fulva]|uniref:Uncharacterized protein n=1 Tax=Ladona fulva TaxID=123851 RepID=A0A8K0KPF8_LADFU|nr:hypothetical protein J437_LFUL015695 [Ladona fulva]